MSELDEAIDWVPLNAALAWVKDAVSHEFQSTTEQPDGKRHASDPWESEVQALRLKERDALRENNAWLNLRSAIVAEKVRARGFSESRKIAALRPEREKEGDEEEALVPTKKPLPPTEANDLIPVGNGRLQSAEFGNTRGLGWNNVVISRMDLNAVFPVGGNSDDGDRPGDARNSSFASDGDLDWKIRLLQEVIKELWPRGMPSKDPGARKERIEVLFRQKLTAKAQSENHSQAELDAIKKVTVGLSTIRKANRLIKEGK